MMPANLVSVISCTEPDRLRSSRVVSTQKRELLTIAGVRSACPPVAVVGSGNDVGWV